MLCSPGLYLKNNKVKSAKAGTKNTGFFIYPKFCITFMPALTLITMKDKAMNPIKQGAISKTVIPAITAIIQRIYA